MRFRRYKIEDPEAFRRLLAPGDEVPWSDRLVRAAGFDPRDEELALGRLAVPWNGHPAGAPVVYGLLVSGHPFAVGDNPWEA